MLAADWDQSPRGSQVFVKELKVQPQQLRQESSHTRAGTLGWRVLPQGSKTPLCESGEQEDPRPLSSPPLPPGEIPQVISNSCLGRSISEIHIDGAVGIPAHSLGRSLNRLQLFLPPVSPHPYPGASQLPLLRHLLTPTSSPRPLPLANSCPSRFPGSDIVPPAGSLPRLHPPSP